MAFFVRDVLRLIVGALATVLFGCLTLQPAIVVYRALDATQRPGTAALLAIATFLAIFLGLLASFRIAMRRLVNSSFDRFYREFCADNEFPVEGWKSGKASAKRQELVCVGPGMRVIKDSRT